MKLLEDIILEEVKSQFGDDSKTQSVVSTNKPGQSKDIIWINETADKALPSALNEFCKHAQKTLGFNQPVTIRLRKDEDNAQDLFGLTGHYSPSLKEVVVYTTCRHPKDILRSVSHELVHHLQNCRGEFDKELKLEEGYAQTDMHMRRLEEEAFQKGNMLFRDWCDKIKEERQSILDENAISAGGAGMVSSGQISGGPTGGSMSDAHNLMWSGDDERKKKDLNESKMVKIYRAMPASANTIRPNDYITMGKKFAIEHAVTSAIYNDEPFAVVMKMVPAENVVPADNPGEYRWGGEEIKVRPLLIADTEGNVTRAPMAEERIKKNKHGVDLFQMGSSLPDELYNKKNGEPSRDPGINETYYHGSTKMLKVGDYIFPPSVTGKMSEKGRKKNLDKVFFTKDLGSAKIYAGRAKHSLGGDPVIYEVEPEGDIEIINAQPGTTVYAARRAKVLKKL